MNKIITYWKNKKGITLVWGAIFLVFLLMCAGMAIDLAYLYHVRIQLHVAADAAALAGAAILDPLADPTFRQIEARKAAWRFACKNKAAGDPVFLVTDAGRNHSSPDCDNVDALTDADLNAISNDPSGDIVVGNWNPTRPRGTASCDDQRFLPTVLCDGTTVPLSGGINAVKAVPRRTGETTGMPRVSVFFGRIFRILGPGEGWSFMSAAAQAIASRPLRATSFVAMGSTACDVPITFNPDCVAPETPYPCCTGAGTATCRVLDTSGEGSCCASSCTPGASASDPSCSCCWKFFAWTGLSANLSGSTFDDLACRTSPNEEICDTPCTPGGQIFGLSGGSIGGPFADYQALMYDPDYDSENKEIPGGNVTGWTVTFPWTTGLNPLAGNPDCGGATGGAYSVLGYVTVHITAVCLNPGATGNGCRNFPPEGHPTSDPPACAGYPDKSIVIDSISCHYCGSDDLGQKVVLVK